MNLFSTVLNQEFLARLLIITLCLSNFSFVGAVNSEAQRTVSQQRKIQIIQDNNSIRAVIGDSSIGIQHGSSSTPQSLALLTEFSQKIAKVKIFNRRKILENEIELAIRNTFELRFEEIIEFDDSNNNSLFDFQRESRYRMVNLSDILFEIDKLSGINSSEDELKYELKFSASDIPYSQPRQPSSSSRLENLSFTFTLFIKRTEVLVNELSTITIQPLLRGFNISREIHEQVLNAVMVSPRLKFSIRISGWDYSQASKNSKLMLKVSTITQEQISTKFETRSGLKINRETLKVTGLFSKLQFTTFQMEHMTNHNLDHNENQTREYTSQKLANQRLTLGNSLRSFLNFTWEPTLSVDGKNHSSILQILRSGESNFRLRSSIQTPALYINKVFIFPQGSNIYYDPEIQINEINPILILKSIPNRSILQSNSILILVSGIFIAIMIVIRQRFQK
ncbi:MAG: hypothetical protein ACFFDT_34625 [Candidatus Hodarchaeota archaeon]